MKSKSIPAAVIRDALGVCGGIYRMNARHAVGYGFTIAENKKEVGCGEFLWPKETPTDDSRFDGYISFAERTVTDLATGANRPL